MTIQFQEYPDSRSASVDDETQERVLHYWLSGIQDDDAARAYVDANAPAIYDGLFAQSAEMNTKGGGLWDVEILYGAQPGGVGSSFSGSTDVVNFTFDTSGGTAHVTQAREHIASYTKTTATLGADAGHKGAINVTDSGVEGVDIGIDQFSWTENWTLPISYASFSAALIFKILTGKINTSGFRGFGPGQVLFAGANGGASTKNTTQATLSYKFIQSDDSSDAMPAFKAGIAKLGWHYLWAEYEKQEDDTAKRIIQPPVAVHVERVIDYADFSALGIGTGLL